LWPIAEIRDLTGAGDASNADFLAALADDDWVTACRAEHALAGQVIACAGAALTHSKKERGQGTLPNEL